MEVEIIPARQDHRILILSHTEAYYEHVVTGDRARIDLSFMAQRAIQQAMREATGTVGADMEDKLLNGSSSIQGVPKGILG